MTLAACVSLNDAACVAVRAPPPRTLFVVDPGHGGPPTAGLNAGTDTFPVLDGKPFVPDALPDPPADRKRKAWYMPGGGGYIAEKHVALDIANHVIRALAYAIRDLESQTRHGDVMEVLQTRDADENMGLTARTNVMTSRIERAADAGFEDKVIIAAYGPSRPHAGRFHYGLFLSIHADGGGNSSGTSFVYSAGAVERNRPLSLALEARLALIGQPSLGAAGDDHTALKRIHVVRHDEPNVYSSLVEVDVLTSERGYLNLASPTWRARFGRVLALGLWDFAASLYAERRFVRSDGALVHACDEMAERMKQVRAAYLEPRARS